MSTAKTTATTTRTRDRTREKDYEISDVKHLMRLRTWKNYNEMISWLKREGTADSKLTPSEVDFLVADLSRLKQQGTEFISDPARLHEELKRR